MTCVDREARNTCIQCQGIKHVMISGMQVRGHKIASCDGWLVKHLSRRS